MSRNLTVNIRWMIAADMPQVVAIEDAAFRWDGWTEDEFRRVLRERNCIGMVAEYGPYGREQIAGYMVYELETDAIRLLNFAVHPNRQRLGVGRQMLAKLTRKLSIHRRPALSVRVRESNLPAQLFFRSQGLRAVRILSAYHEDEDAYEFEYRVRRPARATVPDLGGEGGGA